jgi:hypothetical protein
MAKESIGQRVYAVRLALGDGWKTPLPQAEFAALLADVSGRAYDSAMVSRMENGGRAVSIEEAEWVAALDPQSRGPAWLAFGEDIPTGARPNSALDRLAKDPEGTVAELRESQKKAAPPKRGGRKAG